MTLRPDLSWRRRGYLSSVKLASPGKTFAAQQTIGWAYDGNNDGSGGAGTGVVDPPIAVTDPANPTTDQVFAFTGCSNVVGIGGAVSRFRPFHDWYAHDEQHGGLGLGERDRRLHRKERTFRRV